MSRVKNRALNICQNVGNRTNKKRNSRLFILLVVFLILWSAFLFFHPPKEIVEFLGIHNTYFFIFLMAAIGGVSAFTSTAFYTTVVTLAIGGVNPLYLGFFASIGLTIGDVFFYFFGMEGKQCIPGKYEKYIDRFSRWVEKAGDWLIALIIFFYSLTPFPSDVLAISLAVADYPLRKMIVPLFIGNFVLISGLAMLSQLGFQIVT